MHEFPVGFRMMTGDANRIIYDASAKANAAIKYVCLDKYGNTETPGWLSKSA